MKPSFYFQDSNSTVREGRKLMARETFPSCAWYEEEGVCRSNYSIPAVTLSESNNRFAEYIANVFVCFSSTSKESCVEKERCSWSTSTRTCSFGLYTTGYEKSPCAKAAPAMALEYSTNIVCQKHETSLACGRGNNCTWLEAEESCIADEFPIYFGLESYDDFIEGTDYLYDAKIDAAWNSFFETYNTNSPFFDWSVALDWEVPKSSCPEDSTTTECDYVDAFLEVYLPVALYCGYQHEYSLSCSLDPVCTYDYEDDFCTISDRAAARVNANAVSTLLDRVEAEVDRDVLTAYISCPTITDWSNCTEREHCRWDYQDSECTANVTYTKSRIGAAGEDSWRGRRDPICKLHSLEANSGCYDIHFHRRCRRTENCHWKVSDDCGLSDEYFLEVALDRANDIEESSADLFWSECEDYDSEQLCLASAN